ncbi:MAG: efflux RND transporter periplasmic adaptor subunit [Deltaproteobacteria bacterium]|nr:efflux RND transporter periplasmic adaptor subunit [Deltaproteobacteria bacterium]
MKPDNRTRTRHASSRLFPALVCLIASVGLLITSCGKGEEEVAREVIRPVKIMTVPSSGAISGLTLPGKVRASRRVELAFKVVGGRLIELPVEGKEGKFVKKGDLLARVDPKDFQVEIRNVQGKLGEARAALKLAKSEYERVLRIKKKDPGAVSGALVDKRREAVSRAQARIKSLKAVVEDAKNRLGYTYLRAPFSGVIAKRYVDNFQEVQPKQPIVSLEDIYRVEILVDVPENVMAMAKEQQKGTVTAVAEFPTAPGKQYPLKLKEYATKADPATQTYQVVFELPQPESINVFPGMTATVVLSPRGEETQETQILIPAGAVLAEPDGKNYVWVVDPENMTVHKQSVKVGSLTGSENIVIQEGLKGGEKIVVAGVLKLQEGMKVRLWDQQ